MKRECIAPQSTPAARNKHTQKRLKHLNKNVVKYVIDAKGLVW